MSVEKALQEVVRVVNENNHDSVFSEICDDAMKDPITNETDLIVAKNEASKIDKELSLAIEKFRKELY